jgi:hypothetical protein
LNALLVQVGELTAQVQALVLKLGKDSSNSSTPPSSDGPGRRPRGGSARKASGRFQALHRLFNGDGPWTPTTLTPPAAAA